ncbi:hypothetical protein BAE44_0021721 [Dichanthelium oligosanthes]|uniref:Uncharacterized protein n=1 Tax=Dichanthelium oligosanthes TaxID=888268 RepID=A0A1E5UWL5_9POAL|nr:hypothetical protein BAE44_0021721 [Dichanthelium oligosanthes]
MAISMYIHFRVNPALDRINDSLEAVSIEMSATRDEVKHSHQRTRGLLDSKESQIEARDLVGKFSQGHTIQTSGISFILSPFFNAHIYFGFQTSSCCLIND